MIVDNIQLQPALSAQRRQHTGDQAVAPTADAPLLAIHAYAPHEGAILSGTPRGGAVIVQQREAPIAQQVGLLESLPDVGGGELPAGLVRDVLYHLAEGDLQGTRQLQSLVLLQYPGYAALAGLAVDPDHGFVGAADVGRIDRQIGDVPEVVVTLLARRETLLDGVLVGAGEGGEDQVARVGVAGVHRDLIAVLHGLHYRLDIGKIETRVNALAVEVQRQRNQVDVTRALAVAEEAA